MVIYSHLRLLNWLQTDWNRPPELRAVSLGLSSMIDCWYWLKAMLYRHLLIGRGKDRFRSGLPDQQYSQARQLVQIPGQLGFYSRNIYRDQAGQWAGFTGAGEIGEGILVRVSSPTILQLPASKVNQIDINLTSVGWHLVGNPLPEQLNVNQLMIVLPNGETIRLSSASDRKLVEGLYYLDSSTGQYAIAPTANWNLRPGQGFWLNILQPNLKLRIIR